jgi:hypothetical protein
MQVKDLVRLKDGGLFCMITWIDPIQPGPVKVRLSTGDIKEVGASELEVIPPTFKVGDYVCVISTEYASHVYNGMVGKITDCFDPQLGPCFGPIKAWKGPPGQIVKVQNEKGRTAILHELEVIKLCRGVAGFKS